MQGDLVNMDGGFLSLDKKELGVLQLTGKGTNAYGQVSIYVNFVLKGNSALRKVVDFIVLFESWDENRSFCL